MPVLLRDIVRYAVSDQPDLELVAELRDADALVDAVRRHKPDVVVGTSGQCHIEELFGACSAPKVLELETDAAATFLFELRPYRTALGEISRSRLIEAMRS
jgi:DNA-binding NarL/FixJ family response regulator